MADTIKTIVFDMDGVIFDTENLCLKSWEYAARQYGIENILPVFKKCIGTNYRMTRDIVLAAYGSDFKYEEFRKKAGEYFYGYEREHGMPLKPKVRETMEWLKSHGYRLGLASSTDRINVERELKSVGLFDYFESVICGDSVKRSKPAPDIYLEACRTLGEKPENCYAIEDSINGIISAFDAGLKPIMVPDMLPPDERVDGKLTALCGDLFEVCRFLEKQ